MTACTAATATARTGRRLSSRSGEHCLYIVAKEEDQCNVVVLLIVPMPISPPLLRW